MALLKVKDNDLVEIAFQNQDEMKSQNGVVFTSAKVNRASEVRYNDMVGLILGGTAHVRGSDKASITIEFDDEENEFEATGYDFRVERKFIKSLTLLKRFKSVPFGDEHHLHIPGDAKDDLELYSEGDECHDDAFAPKTVKTFLKTIKKLYFDKKKKKKAKKKANKKGMEIDQQNHREGMKVDIKSIPWDDTPDNLNSTELLLAFKGSVKNVEIYYNSNQSVSFSDPTTGNYATVKLSLIKSMTLNGDWAGNEYDDDGVDAMFGELLTEDEIDHHSCEFYEKGMHIGCMTFTLNDVKKLYKELVKVYGEPK